MRNLKRALSLALASVMLVGMMVVGSSAASFPDVDSSNNVEAIEVLKAVEVMLGDEGTGNFRPDDKVSRNEMAVIMAKLILGSYEADSYVGSHPFTDVPSWASKYVAACYNAGIIAGRGEGIYDGGSTVTAVEAAAMMLRALGYDYLSRGADQWDQPVAAKANQIALFKGLTGNSKAELSRDDVAKLALNALEADVVEFTGDLGMEVDMGDGKKVTVGFNARYTPKGDNGAYNYTGDTAPTTGTEGTHQWLYLQLCEDLYDGKLTKVTGSDAFGRDASVWAYDKKEIIKVAEESDRTYVGEVKAKDIYNDLLRETVTGDNVRVYVDGERDTDQEVNIVKNGTAAWGTDGQTVEVRYTRNATDKTEDKIDIYIISTYMGVVTDGSYTEDKKDGIRIDVLGEGGGLKFFEATGYKEDDLVLLTMADGEVQEIIGAPETVSGEATRVSTDAAKALTIDGKKYPQSVKFSSGDNDVVDGETNSALAIEKEYTLYLDQNGCFLAAVENKDNSTTDLVYVFRVYLGNAMDGDEVKSKVMITAVSMDGTYKTIALAKKDGTTIKDPTGATDAAEADDIVTDLTTAHNIVGTLVDLKYDEDDKEYDLDTTPDNYTVKAGTPGGSGVELKTDTRYETLVSAQGNVYLNGDTVYVFVKEDTDPNKIDNVKAVTGGVAFDIGSSTNVAYACDKDKTTAKYVVIADEYEAGADDVVYIKAGAKDDIKDGKTYEGWYADSTEKVKINVDKSTASYTSLPAGFYKYSEKTNGNLKLTAADTFINDTTTGKTSGVISSITKDDKGYLMTLGGVTFDLKDVNVIDMTDKDKAEENTYKSNVTSQSALERVVNQKTSGYTQYAVTVQVYANKDAEVLNLLISNIANAPRSMGSGSKTQSEIQTGLKGGSTLSMESGATLSENTTITEGTLVLTDSGNLNGQTLTVKAGATVKATAALAATGAIVLDGGKVEIDVTSADLPTITGNGIVEVAENAVIGTVSDDASGKLTTQKLGGPVKALTGAPADFKTAKNNVALVGAGKLHGYGANSFDQWAAGDPGTVEFESLYVVDFAGMTGWSGGTSKIKGVKSIDGTTFDEDFEGALVGESGEAVQMFLLANNVQKIKFTIALDGDFTNEDPSNIKTIVWTIG